MLLGGHFVDSLRRSARELLVLAESSAIETLLADFLMYQGVGRPGESERRSWRNSLPVLADDLREAGLGGVQVLMEHRLPLTSKRADVILAGVHPATGRNSYVVLELKQWSRARRWGDSDTLLDVDGARYRPVLHPSLQVDGYVDYLRDFVSVLSEAPESVTGAAYLHNARELGIEDLRGTPAIGAVGNGRRRIRPDRVRVHRAGLRVLMERSHLRPGPRLVGEDSGRRNIRSARAARLQGLAHPRNGGHDPVLD
nr:hypothetical protein [Cellulomonas sp. Leaf334]